MSQHDHAWAILAGFWLTGLTASWVLVWWVARSNDWAVTLVFDYYNEQLPEGILLHAVLVFAIVFTIRMIRHR